MNIRFYDLSCKEDRMAAVDELNSLVADVIVSDIKIRHLATNKNEIDHLLKIRELAQEHWLGMHYALNKMMHKQDISEDFDNLKFFNLMLTMFNMDKDVLHRFLKRADAYQSIPTHKKLWYGEDRYFY